LTEKELVSKIVDSTNIIDLAYVKLDIIEKLFLELLDRKITDKERIFANQIRREIVETMIKLKNYEA